MFFIAYNTCIIKQTGGIMMKKLLFVLGAVTGVCFLGNDCLATSPSGYILGQEDPVMVYREDFELYYRAAEAGDTIAKYHLAVCYENGAGVEKDPVEAFRLWKELADGGDPYAAYAKCQLARCYEYGIGVEKNLWEVFRIYNELVYAGDPDAKWELARCYEHGIGVEKNPAAAIWLYRDAGYDWIADWLEAAVASGR